MLDEPSVWFGFIVLSAVALMPDMALMTIARYFYRTKTQLAQVSPLCVFIHLPCIHVEGNMTAEGEKCASLTITTEEEKCLPSCKIADDL